METHISYPSDALPAAIRFPFHYLAHPDSELTYIGTHYGLDIYINATNSTERGHLYCVNGPADSDYYSAVGYGLTRTHRDLNHAHRHVLAAACALLRHPEYIPIVLHAHTDTDTPSE